MSLNDRISKPENHRISSRRKDGKARFNGVASTKILDVVNAFEKGEMTRQECDDLLIALGAISTVGLVQEKQLIQDQRHF